MTAMRKLKIVLFAALVGFGAVELTESFSGLRLAGLTGDAQAKVGRPLTPVSVAGVSRRSRRRCAAGVTC